MPHDDRAQMDVGIPQPESPPESNHQCNQTTLLQIHLIIRIPSLNKHEPRAISSTLPDLNRAEVSQQNIQTHLRIGGAQLTSSNSYSSTTCSN